MKISSIDNQTNFKGSFVDKASGFIAKHPNTTAALAASSVISQKLVLSSAEAVLGPAMDVGIGEAMSKLNNEKDDRFKQSSKLQAVRSFSQTVGGTVTGIIIRAICIGACTFGIIKGASAAGEKAGGVFAQLINKDGTKNAYQISKEGEAWGRNVGGALATVVMMFTNFIIDAPLINIINTAVSKLVFGSDNASKKLQEGKIDDLNEAKPAKIEGNEKTDNLKEGSKV